MTKIKVAKKILNRGLRKIEIRYTKNKIVQKKKIEDKYNKNQGCQEKIKQRYNKNQDCQRKNCGQV